MYILKWHPYSVRQIRIFHNVIQKNQKVMEPICLMVHGSNAWENFKETKEKLGEYPKVNKTVTPNEFDDFTINNTAAIFQPMARLNNSFYNGLATDDKHYSDGQQVYISKSYPNHYYNTNTFSPFYLAEMKRKDNNEVL